MNSIRLWWHLTKRTREAAASTKDPARITSTLTILAFASVTALLLIVVGGIGGFQLRAAAPGASQNAQSYVMFAYIAGALLLVPLLTMGGAAARLVVARRDERLARLRLIGATTSQITALSALDAASQALIGTAAGIGGYFALIPLIGLAQFEGKGFTFGELWVGGPILLAIAASIVVVGVASALLGLQRVIVSPLGVASRQTSPALKAIRLLSVVLALALMVIATKTQAASIMFIVVTLMIGIGTLNIVGPFIMGVVGQFVASGAKTPDTLLAARRIIDDPKTAWRSVGGVALATFIAGLTAIMALFSSGSANNPDDAIFLTDVSTGGYLTLAIAGVLAAISTGVTQAGRVISQRDQYQFLHLAGAHVSDLEKARVKETTIPMIAAIGSALALSALFLVPIIGGGFLQQPVVLLRYVVSVLFAIGIVLLGTMASRGLVKSVARLS